MTRKTVAILLCALTAAFLLGCGGYFLGYHAGTSRNVTVETRPSTRSAVETEALRMLPAPSETAAGLLDLNTATLEELDALPGIGPVLAQRILDYRAANGPFSAVSELLLVEGIGKKTLDGIIDYLTVR